MSDVLDALEHQCCGCPHRHDLARRVRFGVWATERAEYIADLRRRDEPAPSPDEMDRMFGPSPMSPRGQR